MDGQEVAYHYIVGYVGEEIVIMQIQTQYTVCDTPNVTIRYLNTEGAFVDISSGAAWSPTPVLDDESI